MVKLASSTLEEKGQFDNKLGCWLAEIAVVCFVCSDKNKLFILSEFLLFHVQWKNNVLFPIINLIVCLWNNTILNSYLRPSRLTSVVVLKNSTEQCLIISDSTDKGNILCKMNKIIKKTLLKIWNIRGKKDVFNIYTSWKDLEILKLLVTLQCIFFYFFYFCFRSVSPDLCSRRQVWKK